VKERIPNHPTVTDFTLRRMRSEEEGKKGISGDQ